MTAPRPTGSIDIWNFVDNVTGTTVRKWLRDSWARKKIVALQQAVSSIVVPTRTSQLTNDSGFITSAPVTSVNGKTGAVALDASDVGALPSSTAIPSATSDLTNDSGFITSSKFAVISGTLASAAGNSAEVAYPAGFTFDNCVVLSLMVNYSSQWRYVGDGVLGQSGRLYVLMKSTGVVVYNSLNYGFNQDWKAVLMRTDI